jgi:mannose-6-phosphate isomerase-like protein (cupin superfamily)
LILAERLGVTDPGYIRKVARALMRRHCHAMNVTNISTATEWFQVLQTTKRSQTAMMKLKPGAATGEKAESHDESDQVLLMLEGELIGEVGSERPRLKKGDVIVIEAGTKHRFANASDKTAVTFNVYSPAAYPADTKG